jgi:thiol-disulfide isomerase/thioredoxin
MAPKELQITGFTVRNNKVYVKNVFKPGMLLIYATWCGFCRSFKPTYDAISAQLGNDFVCAQIESEQLRKDDKISSALNFTGFPTIKFFDQTGLIIDTYEGSREKGDILKYICKIYHKCVMEKRG